MVAARAMLMAAIRRTAIVIFMGILRLATSGTPRCTCRRAMSTLCTGIGGDFLTILVSHFILSLNYCSGQVSPMAASVSGSRIVGPLARVAGVGVEIIRYYQRRTLPVSSTVGHSATTRWY